MKFTILFFVVMLYIPESEECKYVSPPALTQINEELVLVDWVKTASEEYNVKEFILKFWKKDSPWDETPRKIVDLATTFDFVDVERGVIYSYRLSIKSSGKKKKFVLKEKYLKYKFNTF